jgi:NADH:ubiquinone oxidoreductase subunit 5 (subunit L)/multisubunit Na+/H+ antiporter MnhA subunit
MGIMMLACGLGLYGFAIFHIFAHSFYKAYAFLSTGKLVEESKKVSLSITQHSTINTTLIGISCVALIVVSAFIDRGDYLQIVTYVVILLLGFLQNLPSISNLSFRRLETLGKILITLLLGTTTYIGIEYLLNENLRLGSVIPDGMAQQLNLGTRLTISVLIFTMFFVSFVLSKKLMYPDSAFLQRLYVYFRNGGYLGLRSSVFMSRLLSKTIS